MVIFHSYVKLPEGSMYNMCVHIGDFPARFDYLTSFHFILAQEKTNDLRGPWGRPVLGGYDLRLEYNVV